MIHESGSCCRPAPGGSHGQAAARQLAARLHIGKHRSVASQRWLKRQINGPHVAAARVPGLRSRDAFKREELDAKYRRLKRRTRVLDLGAAPGDWTRVAVERAGPRGTWSRSIGACGLRAAGRRRA